MPGTGPRLFGRELDLPETAVTVRVRDGRPIINEGPGADADASLSRINVIECADLDAALVSSLNQVAARASDTPYLLLTQISEPSSAVTADRGLIAEVEAWRRDVDAQGRYVMGSSLGGIETAAIQRLRAAPTIAADSPFNQVDGDTVAVEVILAADRRQALELAGAHPLARLHAIEVRPFLTAD